MDFGIFSIRFQIDLKKMPLGKLSKKQIESAYKVLNELNQVKLLATALQKQVNGYRHVPCFLLIFLRQLIAVIYL